MPPQPRQRTKLGKNRPGLPAQQPDEHEQELPDSSPSRGRAEPGRTGAQDPGAQNPGAQNPGAQNPRGGRTVAWTPEAKAARSALTAWAAARRKAQQRANEARDAGERVPATELAVIADRIAASTGEPISEVRRAAGLPDAAQ